MGTRTSTKTSFCAALLRDKPLLLDGGLATQLEAQGCDISGSLWSASLLQTDPGAIVAASRAYLEAGAECIATCSYQASFEGFKAHGIGVEDTASLMRFSVELALRAREEFLAAKPDSTFTPLIAASLGPYGAMLHDGSEYLGDYGVSAERLQAFHAERLALFDATDADVLAMETIPSAIEAEVLSELLADCASPAWVSFSCKDAEHISDGTRLDELVGIYRDHPAVAAVGINCTPPQFATDLIRTVRKALPGKAVIAYPNSGEVYHVEDNTWSGTATALDYAAAARDWVDAGARIVGGCCRTGPEHISAMKKVL